MTQNSLKKILDYIKNFVKNSRPAYKDYLGIEYKTTTFIEFTKTAANDDYITFDVNDQTGWREIYSGETYDVTIDGVTTQLVATRYPDTEYLVWLGNFPADDTTTTDRYGVMFRNDLPNNKKYYACNAWGSYVGKKITVSKTNKTKKYDIKKLDEELLPDPEINLVAIMQDGSKVHLSLHGNEVQEDESS